MKKWTALVLSILLAASVGFTGCGKDETYVDSSEEIASDTESTAESDGDGAADTSSEDTSSEENASEESSSEVITSEETSSAASSEEESSKEVTSKPTSSKEESSKEVTSKPTSSKGESSSKAESSSKPTSSKEESSKEVTSKPASSEEENAPMSIGCMTLLETAIDGTELPGMMFYEPSMDDAMEAELSEYFYTGLDFADLSDYCVGVPMMMVHASEIAVFKPVDAAAAKRIKAVLDTRVQSLTDIWSTYLPDQYALVEDHRVVEENGYILFVVAADADKIVKQFKAAL